MMRAKSVVGIFRVSLMLAPHCFPDSVTHRAWEGHGANSALTSREKRDRHRKKEDTGILKRGRDRDREREATR